MHTLVTSARFAERNGRGREGDWADRQTVERSMPRAGHGESATFVVFRLSISAAKILARFQAAYAALQFTGPDVVRFGRADMMVEGLTPAQRQSSAWVCVP